MRVLPMRTSNDSRKTQPVPKKRARHYAYDTNLDEPGELLKNEAVDIEEEVPSEDTEPIEKPDQEDTASPIFQE